MVGHLIVIVKVKYFRGKGMHYVNEGKVLTKIEIQGSVCVRVLVYAT